MRTLKRFGVALVLALGLVVLLHPAGIAQDVTCEGSFTPSFNCRITGLWDFITTGRATPTYPVPFKVNGTEVTGIISASVDLTNAQVLALGTTPVTIVSAPGAGKFVDVIAWSAAFNYTGAYTSAGDIALYWGSRAAGNRASVAITGSGFFDATSDQIRRAGGVPDNTSPPATNLALVVQKVLAANMGGGNAANSVRVVVNYRIVATGL